MVPPKVEFAQTIMNHLAKTGAFPALIHRCPLCLPWQRYIPPYQEIIIVSARNTVVAKAFAYCVNVWATSYLVGPVEPLLLVLRV